MPIDKSIFAHQMGILADRFGRALQAPTFRAYYEALSAVMTTQQFIAATELAFRGEKFWPTPDRLVELVRPRDRAALSGAEIFERVLEIMTDPRRPIPERVADVQALGSSALRAFRAAGGARDFANVLEADVTWLRRRFVDAFEASCDATEASERACIAAGNADVRVAALLSGLARQKALPSARMDREGDGRI